MAVNLYNLRPEVCTLLVVRTKDWFLRHGRDSAEQNRFHVNDEWWNTRDYTDQGTAVGSVRYRDLGDRVLTDGVLRAAKMVPPGAAAFWLGLDTFRDKEKV